MARYCTEREATYANSMTTLKVQHRSVLGASNVSKRLLVLICLIGACKRSERTNGASAPARTAPVASPSGSPAVPRNEVDASAPPLIAPGISSAASAARRGTKRTVVAAGFTSGLTLEGDTLSYCDNRGGRAVDLASGVEIPRERPCDKHEERNSGCGGIDFVESVREPDQDDIIDAKMGPSFPVHGHIHDCAFSSGILLVATGQEIITIDVKTDRREVKGKDGGDQVAINDAWLAWSDGRKVFAQRR